MFLYQLFVAMQSIYHPVLSTKVQSFTGRTPYEKWFIGKQTDSARYSWQTYPNLAVSRLGSKVCENDKIPKGSPFLKAELVDESRVRELQQRKAIDLLGNAWRQLMFSGFDISSLWLCKASTILYWAQKFSHSLAEPLMRSDSLASRLIVLDIPDRLTPILLLADWVQKSVKMTRFQRVLHFWRPNWWMSPGFENYNREKQLTCWAMHEDNRCFWNYGAFVNCKLPLFCCKGIGRRRRDELKPTEIYTSTFQRVSRVQGVVVEDNPTKAADSHQKSVKIQDSKGFCISEGRIGGWVQGSIITTKKSNWLVGQCMKTADVSLSALCGCRYAKHLSSCTAYKGSVISWQNCSWKVSPWHADW